MNHSTREEISKIDLSCPVLAISFMKGKLHEFYHVLNNHANSNRFAILMSTLISKVKMTRPHKVYNLHKKCHILWTDCCKSSKLVNGQSHKLAYIGPLGHFIKNDNPFGSDRTLGLVLICMNFWSDNKHLVLSCRLSETSG